MKKLNCNSCNSSFFQNLLEAGMPAVCPNCVPVYSLAKNISRSNDIPQEVRDVAKIICGGVLLFIGAVYLDKFADYLKS